MKENRSFWKNSLPFGIALSSMAIYYLSLPPVGLRFTIFLVPAIWTAILASNRVGWRRVDEERPKGFMRRIIGWAPRFFCRGEYRQYWLASLSFWLCAVVWVSYPHPATILGWFALSGYLAFYFPLFIFQTRALHRALRLPLWFAASLAWLSCEALRNVVMGGFSFAGLSHALYNVPELIQIADLFGEYGVNVMIMLVGSLLGCGFFRTRSICDIEVSRKSPTGTSIQSEQASSEPTSSSTERSGTRLISFALILLLGAYLYSYASLARLDELEAESIAHGTRPARIALLQDGETYQFPVSKALTKQIEESYLALAHEASKDPGGFDVIVWPEGTYPGFFMDFCYSPEVGASLPKIQTNSGSDVPPHERRYSREWVLSSMRPDRLGYANLTSRLKTPAILGMASAIFNESGSETSYNAAIYVPCFGSEEESAALPATILEEYPTSSVEVHAAKGFRRYDKVCLVMFGEYIPFANYLPDSWGLKAVCAETALGRGRGPSAFIVPARDGGFRYTITPHICFESAIPHFISNQLAELRASNVETDILLNISNDGWFRNGSQTDLHLATMVFRAIENRRPLVTATHGGFSAYLDAGGRVRSKGTRGGSEVVEAIVPIVKIHPRGLIRREKDDAYLSVPDVMRRVGFGVFVASLGAQILLVVMKRRRIHEV